MQPHQAARRFISQSIPGALLAALPALPASAAAAPRQSPPAPIPAADLARSRRWWYAHSTLQKHSPFRHRVSAGVSRHLWRFDRLKVQRLCHGSHHRSHFATSYTRKGVCNPSSEYTIHAVTKPRACRQYQVGTGSSAHFRGQDSNMMTKLGTKLVQAIQ